MNVPAVVSKTFEEFKDRPEYMEIVKLVVEGLGALPSPLDKARFIHQVVDELNQDVFSQQLVKDLSPCKMGCSACCHTQVSVTLEEAKLLAQRVADGVSVDEGRLKLQAQAQNDHGAFYQLSYEERRCVFLDENGTCRVYEDRPSVCRTNAVLGRAEQCDTKDSIQPVRLVKTSKADMAIYGSFLFSTKSGSLPNLLEELLK